MPDQPVFICPKCQTGELGKADEKHNVLCGNPQCRRKWRLMPDHQSIMSATTTLVVHNARQGHKADKPGGRNG